MFGSGLGARVILPREALTARSMALEWVCTSRAQIAALRAFLDARKGRVVPFWLPTWERDLSQRTTLTGVESDIVIEDIGYSEVFGIGNARRHFAFIRQGQPNWYGKATAAADNGDGTETVSFGTPIGQPGSPGQVVVSTLLYVRLDHDEVAISYRGGETATATLNVREVGMEAP